MPTHHLTHTFQTQGLGADPVSDTILCDYFMFKFIFVEKIYSLLAIQTQIQF